MAWVNLNDVYVNKTGGTITGDLTVNGSIKVNDGKGDGGIYNVANEITTLRDSVSQDTGWLDIYPKDEKGSFVRYRVKHNIVYVIFKNVWGVAAGRYWKAGTLPSDYKPAFSFYSSLAMRQSNNTAMAWIGDDGEVGLYPMATLDSDGTNAVSGIVSYPI